MALADALAFVPPGFPGSEAGEEFLVMMLDGTSEERPPYPGAPAEGA
jgi:hypothetical protein